MPKGKESPYYKGFNKKGNLYEQGLNMGFAPLKHPILG